MSRGYKVVFSGQLVEGVAEPRIRFALADRFKLERSKIDQFFTGQPFVIKVFPEREAAEKFQTALTRIGLICSVIELKALGPGEKLDKPPSADHSTPPTEEQSRPSRYTGRSGPNTDQPLPPAAKMVVWVVSAIAVVWFVIKATSHPDSVPTQASADQGVQIAPDVVAPSFSLDQLCKGAVATLMGRPANIMHTSVAGDIARLYYTRAGDGTKWTYKCRLDGHRIVWAADKPGGRWRTHPFDEVLTYSEGPNGSLVIHLRFSDGSSTNQTFTSSDLRRE